jgi:hypothetical protein
MAARKGPSLPAMTHEHRSKIKVSQILNALEEHVMGKRDMQQTQVTAAVALLRKVMPDLSQTTMSGDANNPVLHRVIITGVRRAGDTLPNGNPVELKVIEDVPRLTSKDH